MPADRTPSESEAAYAVARRRAATPPRAPEGEHCGYSTCEWPACAKTCYPHENDADCGYFGCAPCTARFRPLAPDEPREPDAVDAPDGYWDGDKFVRAPDEGARERDDTSEADSWALEVLCRVFDDGADVAIEEWQAWYKPGEWLHPSRALGAFIYKRLIRTRDLAPNQREAILNLMAAQKAVSGTGKPVQLTMGDANALMGIVAVPERAAPAPSPDVSEDAGLLDWLESNKGRGKGGWQVIPPRDGWALQVYARGPYHSLRQAIRAARLAAVEGKRHE